MLWTLFIVLLVLWLLGVVSSYTLGGFVHLLLVLAILALIFQLLSEPSRRRLTTENKRSPMDKDRIKGKIKDIAGRVQRQTGEWTGSEEQQVNYTFYCNGPITGYQLESQVPVTGIQSPPLASKERIALADSFSCSGEIPGWAVNCVGLAKAGYENITGQFGIGTKICAEPRVDALLTVTYAYLEKGAVTQAISGPFDLGRPKGCPADGLSGSSRLNPATAPGGHKGSDRKHHSKKHAAKKAAKRR